MSFHDFAHARKDEKEEKDKQEFKAKLVSYDEKSVATNEDFGKFDSGLKNKDLLLIDKKKAENIAKNLVTLRDFSFRLAKP